MRLGLYLSGGRRTHSLRRCSYLPNLLDRQLRHLSWTGLRSGLLRGRLHVEHFLGDKRLELKYLWFGRLSSRKQVAASLDRLRSDVPDGGGLFVAHRLLLLVDVGNALDYPLLVQRSALLGTLDVPVGVAVAYLVRHELLLGL